MKTMKKVVGVLALAVLAVAGVAKAEAAPIVYVDPVSQLAEVGDPVSIDIWIKNLTESIGAFDLDLAFDDAILTGTTFSVDPDGNFVNDFNGALSFGFGLDVVNIAESGDPAGDNLLLSPFRLGTINFTAAALGNSLLTITFNDLSNNLGTALLPESVQPGIVCVVADATVPQDCVVPAVPEPGLLALLGAGVSALVIRRRRVGSQA